MACVLKVTSQPQRVQTKSCGIGTHRGFPSDPECAVCAVRQSQENQVSPFLSAFRPAGWDNEKKIAILHENFTTVKPEDVFEDFITKPPVRKVPRSVILIKSRRWFSFLMGKETYKPYSVDFFIV